MSFEQAPGAPPQVGELPPPPGVIPNFTNPYSIITVGLAANLLFFTLTIITTAIRCYTKLFLIRKQGWDDCHLNHIDFILNIHTDRQIDTMYIAWAGNVAYLSMEIAVVQYGGGVHQWDVLITKLGPFARVSYFDKVLYSPVVALVKVSICLQFMRIFVVNRGKEFWCIHILIWINEWYFLTLTIFSIFQCEPVAKYWDFGLPGHCIDLSDYFVATGIFNLASDFLMLLFPLYCTWKLHMSRKRKTRVSAIFFIGELALVSDGLRIVYSVINANSPDKTFNLPRLSLCAAGETTAGMFGGNLVVFPKLFNTYYPKITRSSNDAAMALKLRLTRHHIESSAPWSSDEHSTSAIIQQDYTKLKQNNAHALTTSLPSQGGRGAHTEVSTTISSYNSEHDRMELADETNIHNGIRKTVRVDQGVQYG